MISWICGEVVSIDDNSITLKISKDEFSLGYEVIVSNKILSNTIIGQKETFYIYNYIKEDANMLFGFSEYKEKQLFLKLTSVSGLGAKSAMNIISLGYDQIINAIFNGDEASLCQAKNIGKKMASRIIVELKNDNFFKNINVGQNITNINVENDKFNDAVEALMALGIDNFSAKKKIAKILNSEKDISLQDLIRKSLQ